MKKPFSRFLALLLLLLSAALCLSLMFGANYLLSLPERAAQMFGPPSPFLTTTQSIQLSYKLLQRQNELLTPANPRGEVQRFSIALGESTASVIERLFAQYLISDPDGYRDYLVYSGFDTQLQAGDYQFSPEMNALQITQIMLDSTPQFITFTILAGWRLEEVAAALPTSGFNITPEVFLAAVQSPPSGYSFSDLIPDTSNLEGFLLPGTYELLRSSSASQMVGAMLTRFEKEVNLELQAALNLQRLDVRQAVILASIIQREAVLEEEQPLIASVFLNRLAIQMKLDADPTVQYSLGYNLAQGTWWTNPLSLTDLRVDSPYNTYLYTGLPPGPIANPSLSALEAVAFPAQTPYYYFRAACDNSGRHLFAETFDEHLANACSP